MMPNHQSSTLVQSIRRRCYANLPSPRRKYRESVQRLTPDASRILDIGCGYTAPTLNELNSPGTIKIGIDLVDKFTPPQDVHVLRADGGELPFENQAFDLVISRSVLEHLPEPLLVFREVFRVLCPGGRFVFLTPNRWDYVSVGASLIPNRLHPWLVQKMTGRDEDDTFPTMYRANSVGQIRSLARQIGYHLESIELLREHPHYLQFNSLLYAAGTVFDHTFQRFVHSVRPWILGVLRRPADSSA